MMFGEACVNTILFHNTKTSPRLFACFLRLHCLEHTKVAWNRDGLHTTLSSTDGYVSVIYFEGIELGYGLFKDHMPR